MENEKLFYLKRILKLLLDSGIENKIGLKTLLLDDEELKYLLKLINIQEVNVK